MEIQNTEVEVSGPLMFPTALQHLFDGHRIRRECWPKGRYIYLKRGAFDKAGFEIEWVTSLAKTLFDEGEEGTQMIMPDIGAYSEMNVRLETGWFSCTYDMLAGDWHVV